MNTEKDFFRYIESRNELTYVNDEILKNNYSYVQELIGEIQHYRNAQKNYNGFFS